MLVPQKLLKHGYTDSVTDIIFFTVCKMSVYFFGVMEANNNSAGKVSRQPWNALTLQLSLSLHDIRSCLLCKFISLGACPSSLPSIFRNFRQENRIAELFY